VHFRICAQRVADDDEEEIADRHDQAHGETNRGLAAVRSDAKWYTDNRKRDASERERKAFVYFSPAGAAFSLVLTLQLLEQLLD